MNDNRTRTVNIQLADGTIIKAEVSDLGGNRPVATTDILSFDNVIKTIRSISNDLNAVVEELKPKKMSIEFGVEIAVESGNLTSLLVKSTGTGSLKVTLEWGG